MATIRRATVNPGRLAELVSPGGPPGRYAGLVLLDSEAVADAAGLWADGHTVPEGEPCTVRLRPAAAWAGGMVYLGAPKTGTLLVCVFPEGAPGRGAVEVCPVTGEGEPVPEEVRRRPQDVWLVLEDGQDARIKVTGNGCALRLEAPLLEICTTGVAATSRVIIDGVPWAGLQLATPTGPTVGPPVPGPQGADALADLARWKADRGEE